uniref:Putative transcription factor LHW n=1 Tax=Davidia involucrata TaxID=16924 RepID=A0A5B6Z5Y6_DAVIN
MGTTPLRQFLQSLCHNSCWNYAVFWKLQHQSQTLLTWEDGCCACPKLTESMESILDDICFKGLDGIFPSSCESSIHDGNLGEYPIGLAVADMSRVQYALGKGVVGEVAYTGNHRWLSHDNISAGELNYKSVSVCPDEWLLQFLGGIKTILLVPVVPHGVLQLGSLEMVAEDLALIAYIKDKFNAHQNFEGYSVPFTSSRECLAESSSSLMSILIENLDEPSTIIMNEMHSEDSRTVDSVKPINNKWSTTNQITPRCMVQDVCHISGKDIPEILNGPSENDISVRSMGLIEVSKPVNHSLNASKSEMMESSIFRFSGLEELRTFSYSNNYNVGVFGEYANDTMDSYFDRGVTEQLFVDKDADNKGHKSVSSFLRFPTDCELHKALGPASLGQTKEFLWDSSVSGEDARNSTNLICNRDLIHGIESSARESSGWVGKGDHAEHLLEAVVAKVYSSSDDNSTNRPNSVQSPMASSAQFAASSKVHSQSEGSALVGEDAVPWSQATSASVASGRNNINNSSPSTSSFESMTSTLIEEQQQKKGYSHLQTRKGSKLSNVSKRRARPGDNQRPRPRDRQLIQDRVKELRELVPNGTKCSIDGLLDRTIKHMLFLRSVTDQADKLRQWVHQEVSDRKNLKSSESKGVCKNGTSWAFELGSELQVCPIVVEDLEYPGHMLIEMLCNDQGLFLEIAEVIHGLELTILKGVMESRSNSTWAHFIVQASKGFHRLDIFWPLMQLLQQNRCPI